MRLRIKNQDYVDYVSRAKAMGETVLCHSKWAKRIEGTSLDPIKKAVLEVKENNPRYTRDVEQKDTPQDNEEANRYTAKMKHVEEQKKKEGWDQKAAAIVTEKELAEKAAYAAIETENKLSESKTIASLLDRIAEVFPEFVLHKCKEGWFVQVLTWTEVDSVNEVKKSEWKCITKIHKDKYYCLNEVFSSQEWIQAIGATVPTFEGIDIDLMGMSSKSKREVIDSVVNTCISLPSQKEEPPVLEEQKEPEVVFVLGDAVKINKTGYIGVINEVIPAIKEEELPRYRVSGAGYHYASELTLKTSVIAETLNELVSVDVEPKETEEELFERVNTYVGKKVTAERAHRVPSVTDQTVQGVLKPNWYPYGDGKKHPVISRLSGKDIAVKPETIVLYEGTIEDIEDRLLDMVDHVCEGERVFGSTNPNYSSIISGAYLGKIYNTSKGMMHAIKETTRGRMVAVKPETITFLEVETTKND